ncbi:MAG: PAS domain S-box protein, partial [Solirubrobacteraceae bacterium]
MPSRSADPQAVSGPTRAEANERFRMLFDRASVGIVSVAPDGTATEANPAVERMLGYSAQELSEISFGELIHPDDMELSTRFYRELAEGTRDSYQHETRYIRNDGQEIWARATVWRDPAAAEPIAVAMLEDITEVKLSNLALGDRAASLERIVATQRDIAAAASGDLEHVMQVIVERAQALTRAEGAMIHLIDGEDVVTRAACGIATFFLHNRRPLKESVSRFAIAARAPLLIEHAENDPRLNSKLRKLVGDRSHICVPLFVGDRPFGAVSVMSTSEEERLGVEDLQTLELLAGV